MGSAQWSSNSPWNVDNSVVECSVIGFPARSPTQFWPVVQVNDGVSGESSGSVYPVNSWATVDISNWVPEGTKEVCLHGIVILSHHYPGDIAEVTVAYRKPGESHDYPYIGQVIDQHGGGQRSNCGVWVPLSADRNFEFKWNKTSSTGELSRAYHGFQLRMTAYGR